MRSRQRLSRALRALRLPSKGLLCDAFAKRANGDWVAKKDVMVPGPGGMLLLKAGQQVDDELQQRLDDECK